MHFSPVIILLAASCVVLVTRFFVAFSLIQSFLIFQCDLESSSVNGPTYVFVSGADCWLCGPKKDLSDGLGLFEFLMEKAS